MFIDSSMELVIVQSHVETKVFSPRGQHLQFRTAQGTRCGLGVSNPTTQGANKFIGLNGTRVVLDGACGAWPDVVLNVGNATTLTLTLIQYVVFSTVSWACRPPIHQCQRSRRDHRVTISSWCMSFIARNMGLQFPLALEWTLFKNYSSSALLVLNKLLQKYVTIAVSTC